MRQETHTRGKAITATVARASLALTLALLAATPAAAFDSEREQNNYRKLGERFLQEQATPEYQAGQLETGAQNALDLVLRDVQSGGDRFSGNLCGAGLLLCNRDHRLDDWDRYGDRHQVVFINRNGAHIEGSVWASHETVNNGQPVPGVVIETGSVQAPENWYRWAAQILAARGYVVLSFDVQGQGRSDLLGSGSRTFRGVPAQDEEHFRGVAPGRARLHAVVVGGALLAARRRPDRAARALLRPSRQRRAGRVTRAGAPLPATRAGG